jgi:TonB family protein
MTPAQGPEDRLEIAVARQFALGRIGSRLASEPELVAAFWNQIAAPLNPAHPDLTVLYCSVRYLGRTYALLEFVAGETLEELVKRSDPASCEREIPLFCKLLDAFEGGAKVGPAEAAEHPELQLIDFGTARASASLTSKLHGAVLNGPGGASSEQIFGESPASRAQVFGPLMGLCERLPGGLPRSSAYGAVNLGECAVYSLAAPPVTAQPASARSFLARTVASPYVIAVATAVLVLVALYGVGGFLARRSMPANAGKLLLPPYSPVIEAPIEPTPEATPEPAPPPATAAKPAVRKRTARQPIPTIVLARGARPLRQTLLRYPDEAQKEHVSGTVEMQLTIAEDGSVQSPRVLSGDPRLRNGLAEEISQWVYQPLRINGKPVPMTTELAIRFYLTP